MKTQSISSLKAVSVQNLGTLRVHDFNIKQALRVKCTLCGHVGIVPAYLLYARCKTLEPINNIVPRLTCTSCKGKGDRLEWDVVWDPEEYKPLKDDPAYTGHENRPNKHYEGDQ